MDAPLLLLVRHASAEGGEDRLLGRTPGVPLSVRGVEEVRALREVLARVPLVAIHTSPRRRTRETAAAIAAGRHLEPVTRDDVDEIDFGHWTGTPFAALAGDAGWRAYNAARGSADVPGGEAPHAAWSRVRAALAALHQSHVAGTTAVVTHGEIVRYAVLQSTGRPLEAWAEVRIDPASVTVLQRSARGWRAAAVDLHASELLARLDALRAAPGGGDGSSASLARAG